MATIQDTNQPSYQEETQQHHAPLPLPGPSEEDKQYNLDMSSGSASVALDHLGPLVVNQDGTLSRIANWPQMTEIEKRNTLRVLGKRNQLRRSALEAKAETEEGKKKE
jgi:hypothetical protein